MRNSSKENRSGQLAWGWIPAHSPHDSVAGFSVSLGRVCSGSRVAPNDGAEGKRRQSGGYRSRRGLQSGCFVLAASISVSGSLKFMNPGEYQFGTVFFSRVKFFVSPTMVDIHSVLPGFCCRHENQIRRTRLSGLTKDTEMCPMNFCLLRVTKI